MPGLIESKQYTASKAALSDDIAGAEKAIDALEWRLMHTVVLSDCPLVPGSADVRMFVVEASAFTPAVIAVFAMESFGSTIKILLLDVRVSEDDESDE
jgi:hypothetical protein